MNSPTVRQPFCYGDDRLGGMGVFGRWKVGDWAGETQVLRHDAGIQRSAREGMCRGA